MTFVDILKIESMSEDDLPYMGDFEKWLEIKDDIHFACEKLNITKPINIDEANQIANYLNKLYL